ncbi:hypothetical protein BMS3Abin02_00360 [bacterium BMS3Abin02]|nr:hypothetical protein BMS3Abin02_00360 [bacterium BMS3Abin02]GBE23079.1 hypothetical protein BMS3Bbin01_02460 [bacterium BMS3Bbin01]
MSFRVTKTWKQSTDPDFEAKKNRVLELYDILDGKTEPGVDDPQVVLCMDEFGPLNLSPRPSRSPVGAGSIEDVATRRRRRRATYRRTLEMRHLFAAHDLGVDKIYGHIKTNKRHVPGVLPVPAQPVPARGADRHRVGQLQPTLLREGRYPRR